MKKRLRPVPGSGSAPRYPDYREGRRQFMRQLGLAVAGGAVASAVGCGKQRAVDPSDAALERTIGGAADGPGPLLDFRPDDTSGMAPDVRPPPIDAGWPETSGGLPDAAVSVPDRGSWFSDGLPPAPDVQGDLDDLDGGGTD